jgi:hypothetical protein
MSLFCTYGISSMNELAPIRKAWTQQHTNTALMISETSQVQIRDLQLIIIIMEENNKERKGFQRFGQWWQLALVVDNGSGINLLSLVFPVECPSRVWRWSFSHGWLTKIGFGWRTVSLNAVGPTVGFALFASSAQKPSIIFSCIVATLPAFGAWSRNGWGCMDHNRRNGRTWTWPLGGTWWRVDAGQWLLSPCWSCGRFGMNGTQGYFAPKVHRLK